MTKVLHIAETINGGIASYFDELVPLQNERYGASEVAVMVPRDEVRFLTALEESQVQPFERRGRNFLEILSFWLLIQRKISSLHPDIVHAHSSFAGGLVRLSPALLFERAAVVYCAHGWSFLMERTSMAKWFYRLLERILASLCDAIINISRYELNGAIAAGLRMDKLHLVYSGIAPLPAQIDSDRASAKAKVEQPVGTKETAALKLLYVGRLDFAKGIDLVLSILPDLHERKIELKICGAGVQDSGNFAFPENVEVQGWVARETLDAHYEWCDAVIMPSRSEGFGLVAIEAMRHAKAVIASNRGSLPELVSHDVSGLIFDRDNPATLTQILRTVTLDRLHAMGKEGQRRFSAEFTADRMENETDAVYRACLRNRA